VPFRLSLISRRFLHCRRGSGTAASASTKSDRSLATFHPSGFARQGGFVRSESSRRKRKSLSHNDLKCVCPEFRLTFGTSQTSGRMQCEDALAQVNSKPALLVLGSTLPFPKTAPAWQ
jgi:hypothetical protein